MRFELEIRETENGEKANARRELGNTWVLDFHKKRQENSVRTTYRFLGFEMVPEIVLLSPSGKKELGYTIRPKKGMNQFSAWKQKHSM